MVKIFGKSLVNIQILIQRLKKRIGLKSNLEKFIPEGYYCYRSIFYKNGILKTQLCPFWDKKTQTVKSNIIDKKYNGYCHYLKQGDDELGLLWDQVKECGVKIESTIRYEDLKNGDLFKLKNYPNELWSNDILEKCEPFTIKDSVGVEYIQGAKTEYDTYNLDLLVNQEVIPL